MRELGLTREQICDFSASINPLGVPPEVEQALAESLCRISDYPEADAASLRTALAEYHGLSEALLLPGSGSTELIYLLPRVLRPRRALLLRPCFGEYAPALQQAGCQLDYCDLAPDDDFTFAPEAILAARHAETDLVVLANPGNPSGIALPPAQLLELADQLGDCRLLVDEAFVDFCPEHSLMPYLAGRNNLLLLRSLTKFYAIPGLRAGYLAAGPADIALLAAAREPWTLSCLAIAAARACLAAREFQHLTLQTIPQLRRDLQQGLEALGWQVYAGAANYLLCRLPDSWPAAPQLVTLLRPQGLLLRSCVDFPPLDESYLRIAVLNQSANHRLLNVLASVV
jgi:threonine-phosphate decarboxylase